MIQSVIRVSKSYFFLGGLTLLIFCCHCETKSDSTGINDLPDPLEAGWLGASVCEIIQENEQVRILRCTFPPGVGHERHYHEPHVGYTLAGGRFSMTDSEGTREVVVPTGFAFSNDSIIVHEVLNIGETTAQFLIIEYK